MKVNDTIPVYVEGHQVANAIVEELQGDEVWLIIPRTRIKAAVKTSLSMVEEEAETDRILSTENSEEGGESEAQEEANESAGTE